jgi:hypothetical protein
LNIALVAILSVCTVFSIANFVVNLFLIDKKKNNAAISSHEDIEQISEDIINDLVDYCKSEHNIEAFPTSEISDQICLACKKEDAIVKIVELKFPMSPKGSAEYNSTLEYQKEEIDEWRKDNA